MYLTEEEAKTKACPYAHCYCSASKCMGWRTEVCYSDIHKDPKKDAYVVGYCGLIGKPE